MEMPRLAHLEVGSMALVPSLMVVLRLMAVLPRDRYLQALCLRWSDPREHVDVGLASHMGSRCD
jgi:hypothetical protein